MTIVAAPGAVSANEATPVSKPTRRVQLLNFVLFQSAWFAAVLTAARGAPVWGTVCIGVVVGWHLAVSQRPVAEAQLIGLVCLIGFVIESISVRQGNIVYAGGQPYSWMAPYWIVGLWGLLAMTLNVTMRWLKGRWLLAGLLGAIVGPASFASGVRLGAARFTDTSSALLTLAMVWALAMPLLVWLSNRFDGVSVIKNQKG